MWSFVAIEALVRALMKLEGSEGGSHVLRVSLKVQSAARMLAARQRAGCVPLPLSLDLLLASDHDPIRGLASDRRSRLHEFLTDKQPEVAVLTRTSSTRVHAVNQKR